MVVSPVVEGTSGGRMEVQEDAFVTPPGENDPFTRSLVLMRGTFPVASRRLLWQHHASPIRSMPLTIPPTPKLAEAAVPVNPFSIKEVPNKSTHTIDFSPPDNADLKRPRLNDFVSRRFEDEFIELEKLSEGHFGNVLKCLNKISGVEYAVKRRKMTDEKVAWKEVMAYSAVNHPFIVRHCSSWAEKGSIYLQTELCESSLENTKHLSTQELFILLNCTAEALRYLHSQQLAHCAIRPRCVLICHGPRQFYESDDSTEETRFKLGGLRCLTHLGEPPPSPPDRRYIAGELSSPSVDLTSADVYSLALTVYTVASGVSLPAVGRAWSTLRARPVPSLSSPLPSELSTLLRSMSSPTPSLRPTPLQIIDYITTAKKLLSVKDKITSKS